MVKVVSEQLASSKEIKLCGPVCLLVNGGNQAATGQSQDATWMSASGTLKCTTPADVFLFLKSSDFVAHDLEMAYVAIGAYAT